MNVPSPSLRIGWLLAGLFCLSAVSALAAGGGGAAAFPPPLESYADSHYAGVWEVLRHRIEVQPFNLWATLLFLGAVLHTFLTQKLRRWAHVIEERHRRKGVEAASVRAQAMHFLGEVEAVFGIWVVPLMAVMFLRVGPDAMLEYVDHGVGYHEPVFVVVIMAIAATRPVLNLAGGLVRRVAAVGGGGPAAWWFTILVLGPLLGSFITEPAAMTICAALLARQFYRFKPRPAFAYATLGLLFTNVSVGGTLTNFAAPPVLMVAGKWGWSLPFMFEHFGWQAAVGIVTATSLYFVLFRGDFAALAAAQAQSQAETRKERPLPAWITGVHLALMTWSVLNAHHLPFLVGGFLFFIAFHQATEYYQDRLELRSPILVGFFLAGLVIHGGLQQWWMEPVLRRLGEVQMFLGASVLTAFNDNAAITYLATLVPNLTDGMKHAIVAGAVTGGGLTVIANAPNPAGQAILNKYFKEGISPLGLFLGALAPTVIVGAALWFLYFG